MVAETGQDVAITCAAQGDPRPTITWVKVRDHTTYPGSRLAPPCGGMKQLPAHLVKPVWAIHMEEIVFDENLRTNVSTGLGFLMV